MLYKKTGQNPARSSSVMGRSSQIRQDLNQIWWDLARSGQIPANFGYFFFCRIQWLFAYSSKFFRFRWLLPPIDHHPNLKLTWPIVVGSRFLVPSPSNWCQWVRFGLGPKPNQRHPWTDLISSYELLVQDIESTHFFCISWPSSLTIPHLCFYFSKLTSYLAECLKILKYKNQACPKIFGLADPLNSEVFLQILNLTLISRLVSSGKCIHNNNDDDDDKP